MLNFAIQPGIDPNFVGDAMEIDYVRVYEQTATSTETIAERQIPTYFPNPVDNELTIVLKEANQDAVLLNIYSIDGKLVKSVQCTFSDNMIKVKGLEGLDQGYYFISFRTNNQNYSLKFLKK